MTTQPQPEALPQASDDITQRLLSELAGIDTHDVNLRDHPDAWEAVDRFVRAYATEHAARVHAECEALRMERDALRAAARHGGWAGYIDSDALRADAEHYKHWPAGSQAGPVEVVTCEDARAAKSSEGGA